jgi:hypothetical protein
MSSGVTKLAWIHDGQPNQTGHFDCPCGHRITGVQFAGPASTCERCGAVYDGRGWVITGPARDSIAYATHRAHRYAMGPQQPHHFEFGPGGSPYCAQCGCTAEGFYHRGVAAAGHPAQPTAPERNQP